jgi:hypothetical protein
MSASAEPSNRYSAAVACVRDAISTLDERPIAYVANSDRARWYSGPEQAGELRRRLANLDAKWQFAKSDSEREIVARNAGTLAAQVMELVPPCGCTRGAGIIDIQSPGSIKAEMETVDSVIRQLDSDIQASNVDAAFKRSWRVFVDEWEKFYKDHAGWFDRLWYSSYEKTVEFRKRALAWREKFVALGGSPSGPADQPPKSFTEELWKYGKWLLLGGAAFLGWKLWQANRKPEPAPAIRNARRSKPFRVHLDQTQLVTWFEP